MARRNPRCCPYGAPHAPPSPLRWGHGGGGGGRRAPPGAPFGVFFCPVFCRPPPPPPPPRRRRLKAGGVSATLHNPDTQQTATLAVGESRWGWELLLAGEGSAVVEHDFDEWAQISFLWTNESSPLPHPHSQSQGGRDSVPVRKPIGHVTAIAQPIYDFGTIDPQYASLLLLFLFLFLFFFLLFLFLFFVFS